MEVIKYQDSGGRAGLPAPQRKTKQ